MATKRKFSPQAGPIHWWEAYLAVLVGFCVLALGWWFGYQGYFSLTTAGATAGTAIAGALALPQFIVLSWADRSDELSGKPRNKKARTHAGWLGLAGIASVVFFAGATVGTTIAGR